MFSSANSSPAEEAESANEDAGYAGVRENRSSAWVGQSHEGAFNWFRVRVLQQWNAHAARGRIVGCPGQAPSGQGDIGGACRTRIDAVVNPYDTGRTVETLY